MVVHADVQAVHDFQRRFVDFRDNRVVGVGRRMDDPQSVVVRVEIDDVVLCRVEVLSYVDVLDDFGGCELEIFFLRKTYDIVWNNVRKLKKKCLKMEEKRSKMKKTRDNFTTRQKYQNADF